MTSIKKTQKKANDFYFNMLVKEHTLKIFGEVELIPKQKKQIYIKN